MIPLLDTSEKLSVCDGEIGTGCGQLLTPLTRFNVQDYSRPWAIDNGAFSRFDAASFCSLLERERGKGGCLFVVAPDIVGSARRTLEAFPYWSSRIKNENKPLALAIQDGQENLPIPWSEIDAIFIGGSTLFKTSHHVVHIIKTAQIAGKWIHVGRVNDPGRFAYFEELGAHSCDGSGLAQYSHMRQAIARRDWQKKICLNVGIHSGIEGICNAP